MEISAEGLVNAAIADYVATYLGAHCERTPQWRERTQGASKVIVGMVMILHDRSEPWATEWVGDRIEEILAYGG